MRARRVLNHCTGSIAPQFEGVGPVPPANVCYSLAQQWLPLAARRPSASKRRPKIADTRSQKLVVLIAVVAPTDVSAKGTSTH